MRASDWVDLRRERVAAAGGIKAIRSFHATLDALEAVLRLHWPCRYYESIDMCNDHSEAHADDHHFESVDGEWVCDALPDGWDMCEACCDIYGEHMDYPCPTVQAINEALGVDGE